MSVEPARRVIVGLSGGVDSAVAALLLKQQGCHVEALFMKNWGDDDDEEYCASRQDLIDATAVADVLGIDIDQINFSADYRERVFRHFLSEYQAGRTPNPDVLCNAEIKFKSFLDHALTRGAGKIATGHYAQVTQRDGRHQLLKGADAGKDQSYFLCHLNQQQLARTLFPVGNLRKSEVRKLAKQAGLAVHDKKDSTGICFIGERPFREFLNRYLPARPGPIKTPEGGIIGQHNGAMFYTLGQREGLQIGGVRGAKEEPWYVVGKDVASNTLIAAQGHDHPLLMSRSLAAVDLNWISGEPPHAPFKCTAKTRYRQPDQPCTILEIKGNGCRVEFDAGQRAVTPGQTVVFYDGQVCLGGGTILSTTNSLKS
ncbi:MAG TPA: tRNA 2-thiouridine(34) synthase MnmA [Gammaproteobacteria bacterium]|nr:tRNA 2-thiouridine(34) synthase MnmA [Gammaproteobacteria bacterium]